VLNAAEKQYFFIVDKIAIIPLNVYCKTDEKTIFLIRKLN